jgi:quinol monooxygenase YgiN
MGKKTDLLVIASAKAQPGKEKELENALRAVAKPTRAQPGCVSFSLYRSADNPAVIVGFERWASSADHQRHLQGAHVHTLMSAMANVLAEPPQIVAYTILDEE